MSNYWRQDEITVGGRVVRDDVLHIREGDPHAYQGSVHHELSLAYEPKKENDGAAIRLVLVEGQLTGFGASERHGVRIPLQDFIQAIRDLARQHDKMWQTAERERQKRLEKEPTP